MPHVYLAPYVGVGTEADPFRPRGSEQPGWSAIDLRADSTVAVGRALMAVPVRDATIGAYLGDAPDDVSAVIKTAVQSRFGLTLSGARLRDIIPELLLEHAREDGTRWRPLRMMRDGMFRVYLGGLFWQARTLRGGSTITESFNKVDSGILGPDLVWTEDVDGTNVVSNQAKILAIAAAALARHDTDLATDDHYSQLVLLEASLGTSSGISCGPSVRKIASAAVTLYKYRILINTSVNEHQLYKFVAGVATLLGTDVTDVTVGEVLTTEVDGSAVTGKRNLVTSIGPVTDTAIVGHLRTGFRGNVLGGTGALRFNGFRSGDLSDIRTIAVATPAVTPGGAHASTVTITIPSTTAGSTLVIKTAAGDDPNPVAEVISVTATGATFVKKAAVTNTSGTDSTRAECWVATNVSAAITSVLVTWGAVTVAVVNCAEYANVQSLGNTNTATGSTANPTISVTTQDINNFVVAGFANEDLAQPAFALASRGTFWKNGYALGDGQPDVSGCLVDNAFPTAGALANTLSYAGTSIWAAVAVELRSVAGATLMAQGVM